MEMRTEKKQEVTFEQVVCTARKKVEMKDRCMLLMRGGNMASSAFVFCISIFIDELLSLMKGKKNSI